MWEKCSYSCSKKWHSNHSDQRLKCNSLNTEHYVAFIFHFASLISKWSWENKVFYSEGCRCRTLSWKRNQNLQCVVLQKCDGVGGTTAEHVYKIKRWSTFGNIALQASRKILQNLCPSIKWRETEILWDFEPCRMLVIDVCNTVYPTSLSSIPNVNQSAWTDWR